MSNTYLNVFPVEIPSLNTLPLSLTLLILGFIDFLLLHVFKRQESHEPNLHNASSKNIEAVEDSSDQRSFLPDKASDDDSLCRGDMKLVLRSLGFSCNHDDEDNLPARLDPNEILRMFEEKNPGLDEVKEAFDVFDGNKDGFLDAGDLQMVLCALGFSEGSEMENCRRMIRVFDDNGDGRIDFQEFEKLMLNI